MNIFIFLSWPLDYDLHKVYLTNETETKIWF